jgi:hypothetical protein
VGRASFDEAADYFLASADEFRVVGNNRGLALALGHAGLVLTCMHQGKRGGLLLDQAIEVATSSADTFAIGYALFSAGQSALLRADIPLAVSLLEQAVAAGRAAQARRLVAHALCNLVCALAALGSVDVDLLAMLARDCLTTMLEIGDAWALMAAVTCVAIAAHLRGDAEKAVVIFGAADAQRETMGSAALNSVQSVAARSIVALRTGLGDALFERAWSRGNSLSAEATLELVLHGTEGWV